MVEFLEEVLATHRVLLSIIISTLIAAVIIRVYWKRVEFWWTCTWYSFPVIGKIAKLSKNFSVDGEWFSSEKTLCRTFDMYNRKLDKGLKEYDRNKSYLNKIDELGRTPFPIFIWIIISLMVIIEAFGFGYILAEFFNRGASESVQIYAAFGIALIVSVILVWFTHLTGHEIHKNKLLEKIRSYGLNTKNLSQEPGGITIEYNYKDDNEPKYVQMYNRIDTNLNAKSTWHITIVTVILIISIAIGATLVRNASLNEYISADKKIEKEQNDYNIPYPSNIIQTQKEADNKQVDEHYEFIIEGSIITYVTLAIIFIFIQILGVIFGFKWGFAGKESLQAYEELRGFKTKEDFEYYVEENLEYIQKIAEQKLTELQQKMKANRTISLSDVQKKLLDTDDRTFRKFLAYEEIKKIQTNNNKDKQINDMSKNVEENNPTPDNNVKENSTQNEIELCRNPECKKPLKKGAKRCTCGLDVKTEKKCPKCNFVDDDIEAKFCPNCDEKVELV